VQVSRVSQFAPVAFRPDPVLGARVAERLTGLRGRYGVAIKDLNSGSGVLIDPDSEYEAASLFKLSVMYEVFKQRDQGRLALSEVLTLTERHASYDLGTLDRPAGSPIELREALERMITISDNSSAILLTDRVGALTINQDIQGLGMQHTRLRIDDLTTSPGDMLTFFEMLARGRGSSPEASAEMIHMLARQRVNDRIPRLLPRSAVVAHKTGNLPGVVNDAGIVYAPDASFVFVVLVEGTPNETQAAQVISELALLSYEYFHSAAPPRQDVTLPQEPPTSTPKPPTPEPAATSTPAPTATSTRPPTTVPTATAAATAGAELALPTVAPARPTASERGEASASPIAERTPVATAMGVPAAGATPAR
jgi:beta-lactamase class A